MVYSEQLLEMELSYSLALVKDNKVRPIVGIFERNISQLRM